MGPVFLDFKRPPILLCRMVKPTWRAGTGDQQQRKGYWTSSFLSYHSSFLFLSFSLLFPPPRFAVPQCSYPWLPPSLPPLLLLLHDDRVQQRPISCLAAAAPRLSWILRLTASLPSRWLSRCLFRSSQSFLGGSSPLFSLPCLVLVKTKQVRVC